MYNAKLYNCIKAFALNKRISFHMPVHKAGRLYGKKFCRELMALDVTELEDTDNLAAPTGVILDTHESMARLFGAKNAHILVGGSTVGIHAMLLSCLKRGDRLIVDSSVHTSVINACVIYGFEPVFINREICDKFNVAKPLLPKDVLSVIENNKDAKAILITSPTYYGVCSPIKELADLAHKHSMNLLVDCAHGSHFAFIKDALPMPLSAGADMCTVSLHKTLGAPTQTALLLHSSDTVNFQKVKKSINMLQTTSPSYMLMCAADVVCEKMAKDGEKLYKKAAELTSLAKKEIEAFTKCVCLLGKDIDQTRLVINFSSYEISGTEVLKKLSEKYKIDVEMADNVNIVCIVSPLTTRKEIDKLIFSLREILKDVKQRQTPLPVFSQNKISLIKRLDDAFFEEGEEVDIKNACGRICADTISIYPPGTVCLLPGMEIDKDILDKILVALDMGCTVTGISNEKIRVIK